MIRIERILMNSRNTRQSRKGPKSGGTHGPHDSHQAGLPLQGTRSGFALEELAVEDYRIARLKRPGGGRASFGVLDLRGVLTVRDPKLFASALAAGFGRSKAFGCGLMLVRRAFPAQAGMNRS